MTTTIIGEDKKGQAATGNTRRKICNLIALLQGPRFAIGVASFVVDCCFNVQLCPAIKCCIRPPHQKSTAAVDPWAIAEVSFFMFCVPNLTRLIVITLSPSTEFDCDPRLIAVSPCPRDQTRLRPLVHKVATRLHVEMLRRIVPSSGVGGGG